ncbi:helical backbone metal receptor [Shewanella schlegeliana]|uniref:ABC transporter substrate-binding protein n=1 Tax=Shewanella schlegeliana TaxID=190308 RepID=A0ABS1SZQ5_9GAMM|nr:helical backbone metal receptor [Shewanella schlegeliana]MBL4914018.1 ABC transporter substrate-binding protein [Shewanella schlegeliana]MCL1108599.1 helical backbone metal receptor [Shewanella schlegeliana]GIU35681.1 cobalamin-binding protein [Shewanella schlegeliana]
MKYLPFRFSISKQTAIAISLLFTFGISLPASAKAQPRLIALSPHAVEMLFEIGAGENIIGTVDYADYPSAANQIRRIGRHDFIDYEAIMLLQPDAIIVSGTTTASMQSRLRELGFKVVDASVSELKQIPERLIELGELTGHNIEAKLSAEKFTHTLATLKQTYQHRAPVNLFYQIWPMPLTTTASPWMNEIFTGCGANNVFANSVSEYPQVSLEQVLSSTPELIIKPVYHGNSDQEAVNWGKWPEIPAVANKQIVTIEGDLVHRTGPRVLQGMQLVCDIVDSVRSQQVTAPAAVAL